MDRLCDEIIQLIFNELDRPEHLAVASRRYHNLSQDPYVRAHYFLSRYGNIEALFWALGRGKLLNDRVIDILLSSGAHLSRYLVQCAIHHRFRAYVTFVKTPWVRTVNLSTFAHFLKAASEHFGDIPSSKGEDDGAVFAAFIHESRLPVNLRPTKWETVYEIFEKYKFIPFSPKDPLMTQFPLALSIEPRLLRVAVANGFRMDDKYRDFIFRKMFEKNSSSQSKVEDILRNVRQLILLDSSMFVSRTVAAEVCMEALSNEPAYKALKTLDSKGDLRFELSAVVEELIKLFASTRSVADTSAGKTLRHLFSDFPSKDSSVRLVMILIALFSSPSTSPSHSRSDRDTHNDKNSSPKQLHALFKSYKLTPLCKRDVLNVLLNPFVEQFWPMYKYAKTYVKEISEDSSLSLLREVVNKALVMTCKGNLLADVLKDHPQDESTAGYESIIVSAVMTHYQLPMEGLPERDDPAEPFVAPLCRDVSLSLAAIDSGKSSHGNDNDEQETEVQPMDIDGMGEVETTENESLVSLPSQQNDASGLGRITQETLSFMIRQDDLTSTRRRRWLDMLSIGSSSFNYTTARYPYDHQAVGRWILAQFGPRHPVTTVFMIHAVINNNWNILCHYLQDNNRVAASVPVTLKHFRLLARLGRGPSCLLFRAIQSGAQFYESEDDFLPAPLAVKKESTPSADLSVTSTAASASTSASALSSSAQPSPSSSSTEPRTSTKRPHRPRRSAASAHKSYVVPDSDDEAIAEDNADADIELPYGSSSRTTKAVGKQTEDTSLRKWIRALTELQKEELKKYNEEKKRIHKDAEAGNKPRVPKSEFLKTLTSNLQDLRKADTDARLDKGGEGSQPNPSDAEDDDEEYQLHARPAKRRKVTQGGES